MFYFQQLLNTALAGIDGTAIISTVTNLAFAILLIGFLIGLYQAAFRGGDLQALAGTAIKYLVVAMIVSNWATVFRGVNGSFNTVANFIGSSSGAGDMFQSWMGQLQQQFTNNPSLTLTDIITGDAASTITVVLLVVAYLLYALAMIVFCFFYTLFGAVLYVVGPLVLALIPIPGVGQLGKSYAVNVIIWNAWGILYAVFGALITAIQVNQVNNILGNGFLGFLKGAGDSVMLGLVSIFYALAIALIPFIAKRIISGDVGSTVFALVRAGGVAAGAALAGVSGFAAGASSASTGAAASGGVGTSSTAITLASSTPPPAPSMPDFIRSGVASAMNSNSSPAMPASNASSNESSDKRDLAAAMSGSDMGPAIDPIRSPKSSVLTWGERSEELRDGTMPRTISSGRGGFYVEAATDLGAARDQVPTVQHHDPDLLLYRKVFRPFVWPASLIVVEHEEGTRTCG